MPSLDALTKRFEVYVVNCMKMQATGKVFVQTFGPYSDYEDAARDCDAWNGKEGWEAEVDNVYPPAHKNSLLQPMKIGGLCVGPQKTAHSHDLDDNGRCRACGEYVR